MGKTALVLGGGGARGAYEIGVWQALNELGIEIDIVTGSSIGAVNAALVAQGDFDLSLEIWRKMEEGNVTELTENAVFEGLLNKYLDEEKIRNSSIDFGIVTAELPTLKGHCVFAEEIPNGEINEYIMASAACFPFVQPHEIGDKKFIDGGFFDNLPVDMAVRRGATEVIAVDLDSFGLIKRDCYGVVDNLKIISCNWELGSFFQFNPERIKREIRLGYLDAMKAFGAFSGKKYTFIKGEFAKRGLAEAEAAAEMFRCDPCIVYSKEMLDKKIKQAMEEEAEKGVAKGLADEIKAKLKILISEGPKKLLKEEKLAKKYLEKNIFLIENVVE